MGEDADAGQMSASAEATGDHVERRHLTMATLTAGSAVALDLSAGSARLATCSPQDGVSDCDAAPGGG